MYEKYYKHKQKWANNKLNIVPFKSELMKYTEIQYILLFIYLKWFPVLHLNK